ncbi:MAG: zinc-binding dehydrogenase [Anaerolineae bacterium]|nr:zinc-binding dehydrogenase [Anaerolineae bacterium]
MKTMKRAVITGQKQTMLIDTGIPTPKENWVLVKVHAVPLCTEYKSWLSGHEYHGHEAAGEVVQVAQPGKVKVGDRVVVMPGAPCGKCPYCISGEYIHCQHFYDIEDFTGVAYGGDTHVQYLIKQDWLLVPIPDGISYESASLACCGLGPTFGAMENMNVSATDTVLITGCGAVGLGGVVNAKYRGARTIVVEQVPYRQLKASELGADLVLDPNDPDIRSKIMQYTGSIGVDACLETSGRVEAQRLCIDVVRQKGQIALIGECGEDLTIKASPDFIRKGILLMGQWHYNLNGTFKIMKVISESPIIEKMITHVFPMNKIQEALEISATHACGKIILKPWEDDEK